MVDFIPILPSSFMPPTIDAYMGYVANKDFWRNEDIWRGQKVKPKEEYTRYTPKTFVEVGQATGLSPERLKYALTQYFTYGNIWTSLVGGGVNALFDNLSESKRDLVTEELILKKPFVRRMARSTDPYYRYEKPIKEAEMEAKTDRHIVTRDFDNLVYKHLDGDIPRKDVIEFVKQQHPLDRSRLKTRFMTATKLKDIPERRFWLNLVYANPDAKAVIYWNRWKNADKKEQDYMDGMRKKLPGFRSKRFMGKLNQLKRRQER